MTIISSFPSKRPSSTIPPVTGLIGLIVLLGMIFYLHSNPFQTDPDVNGMLTLGVVGMSMIITEIILRFRGFHAPCDVDFYPLTVKRLRSAFNTDLAIKFYGLSIIFLVAILFYNVFPFYTDDGFKIVFKWALKLWPWAMVLGVIYIGVTHSVQKKNRDALWHFGCFFLPHSLKDQANPELVKEQALSWGIKIFFLPLMASFFFDWWEKIGAYDIFFAHTEFMFKTIFDFLFNLFYLIDTAFAVIGYAATFQLLNTHIRYPEVKLQGWAVTISLYNPFNQIIFQQLAHNDGLEWGQYFWDTPVLYAIYCTLILLALAVYSSATVMMGLRMSNLTYRGITTSGPYAFTKHPAYLSKCLSWWMIEIPFIAASPWLAIKNSVMLGLICGLYALRARYEEQMLARVDPMYRDYQHYIRTTGGLWPRAKRFYQKHIASLSQMLEPPKPS